MANPEIATLSPVTPVRTGYDINKDFNKKLGLGLIILGGGIAVLSATLLTLVATGVIKGSDSSFWSASTHKTVMLVADSICVVGGAGLAVWGISKFRASKIDKKEHQERQLADLD
jgi:hypothetical protein